MERTPELAQLAPFSRLNAWEAGFCLRCNRAADNDRVRQFFSNASRLGDGIAWYALLVTLPVAAGPSALGPALHMTLTAGVAVMIYKLIKGILGRDRPYAAHRAVKALVPALDRYSFPSGHTLHAVLFSVMLAQYYPALLVIVLPFAASVALSRVVLGLHYPTDVFAGAALGGLIGHASLALGPVG